VLEPQPIKNRLIAQVNEHRNVVRPPFATHE